MIGVLLAAVIIVVASAFIVDAGCCITRYASTTTYGGTISNYYATTLSESECSPLVTSELTHMQEDHFFQYFPYVRAKPGDTSFGGDVWCNTYDERADTCGPGATFDRFCEPECATDIDCDTIPGCTAAGSCKCRLPLEDPQESKFCISNVADLDGDFVAMQYDCNPNTAVCDVLRDADSCRKADEYEWHPGRGIFTWGINAADNAVIDYFEGPLTEHDWAYVEECWDWCIDRDGDGYCAPESVRLPTAEWQALRVGDWYRRAMNDAGEDAKIAQDFDCDDNNPDAYPGGPALGETCNGVDDDCDGIIDECDGYPTDTYFCDPNAAPTDPCVEFDADDDGFKNEAYGCPDCDDDNFDVKPGANEFPGGMAEGADNNCSGFEDEGLDFDDDGVPEEQEDDSCDAQRAPGDETSAVNPATGCLFVLVGWG